MVYTGDRDLWALMGYEHVKIFSPNKGRMVEPTDWLEEYHVKDPKKIYISKALFGDTSDNIQGVVRLLKKQVEPILELEKCVDIDSFYDIIASRPDCMSEKMWQKTIDSRDKIKLNYRVILPNTAVFDKSCIKRVLKSEENKQKILDILKKYECYSVLDSVEGLFK
jgi:5'-3' exonuclease